MYMNITRRFPPTLLHGIGAARSRGLGLPRARRWLDKTLGDSSSKIVCERSRLTARRGSSRVVELHIGGRFGVTMDPGTNFRVADTGYKTLSHFRVVLDFTKRASRQFRVS